MLASVRLQHELLAVESEHEVSCMLELLAPPAPAQSERRPLALALVIDRSGSMAGEKLDVTRRCAAFLIDHLAPTDRLAIVTFDDEVRLHASLVEVGPHRAHLRAAALAIQSGGQTNLSGGWLKGVEVLSGLKEGEATRRVLLLTDGQANVGITDDETLAKMAGASAADGIGTTTIGFGDGFSEDLLTRMADAGGGGAHYAPTPDAAPAIFAKEFDDLLALVAQNVSAEIRPAWDQVQVLSILNDAPQVQVEGGVQVTLGDAYGDERRRVVFTLRIPRLTALGPAKVADVIVRHVQVGEQVAMVETSVPVIVNAVSAEDAAASVPDAEITEEVVILLASKAQDDARTLADRGRFDDAADHLRRGVKELRRVAQDSVQADELNRLADGLEERETAIRQGGYDAGTRKNMSLTDRMSLKQRRYRSPQP